MKGYEFPVFKTKGRGESDQKFLLDDLAQRKQYFTLKAGTEIEKLKEYLSKNTFVAFLMGKKNSGKGTYAKAFAEIIGSDRVAHISVGDIVRSVHNAMEQPESKEELLTYLQKNYRGALSLEQSLDALLGRSASKLLPTELILALLRREIDKAEHKALFIDGFPRDLDQISYSMYFRDLMGYRDDPDFFVFIDVPESVVDERIRYRVVCPECHTPRNLKLLRTKEVGYDATTKEFYLMCDNPACHGTRMVPKEGDNLGIEVIRDRIELDNTVTRSLIDFNGVSKIFLRNSVPVSVADQEVDDYEITPAYVYSVDPATNAVSVSEQKWSVSDENGVLCYSLLPPPVVVSLICQMNKQLGL